MDVAWRNTLHLGRAALPRWFALWCGVASGWVLIAFLEIKADIAGADRWFLLCCFPNKCCPSVSGICWYVGFAFPENILPRGMCLPRTPMLPQAFTPLHWLIPLPELGVLQRLMLLCRVHLVPILGTNPEKIHSELAVAGGGGT